MNVVLISPGYPPEMPLFTRGLAEIGARVIGVGDQHEHAVPEECRRYLAGYVPVRSLWDQEMVISEVRYRLKGVQVDRIECLWEPFMLLAARLREMFDVPGLRPAQMLPFRDKESMKRTLDAAGLRTPRHARAKTANEVWEYADHIGFPIIVKPIDGAGSADTYRIEDANRLRDVMPRLRHVPEVSVEEFIDGEEYTFDTVTVNGEIAYYNVAWYRPRPLVARTTEWISPQVIALRDVDAPELAAGVKLGFDVIKALGMDNGFTHMEWYRTASGEAVFGEIGARAPGARQVDQMNWACDIDTFRGWARAVCYGRFDENVQRNYNVANIYKRAQGPGLIRRIEGLEALRARFGDGLVHEALLPVGEPRRNWRQTYLSDGYLILRHPDLATTLEWADAVADELNLHAS